MSESNPNDTASQEKNIYENLLTQKEKLTADLKIVTTIYGKVTSSHDYKEFARRTNSLMEKISSASKEVSAKIAQWDQHFKAQAAYNEMLRNEEVISKLWDEYL